MEYKILGAELNYQIFFLSIIIPEKGWKNALKPKKKIKLLVKENFSTVNKYDFVIV